MKNGAKVNEDTIITAARSVLHFLISRFKVKIEQIALGIFNLVSKPSYMIRTERALLLPLVHIGHFELPV